MKTGCEDWVASVAPPCEDAASVTLGEGWRTVGPGRARATGIALVHSGGEEFRLEVIDEAGAAIVSLGTFLDDEVIAIWRSMAASSGLPLLVAGPDGQLGQPYPQLGKLVLGTRLERSRLAVLSGRRPRFLVKRKAARLPRRPLVHREREIVRGRSA